jgi:putative DNA primase/helicase
MQLYADGHYHCFACGAHGNIDELPKAIPTPTTGLPRTSDTLKRGLELWDAAKSIHGTLAEQYLAKTRKLDFAILPDIDAVLRFHPRCPFNKDKHPCVIALFRDIETDEAAGIHRIALTADAKKIDRMMLGSWPQSRAIKLRPTGEKLIVGEGTETTIAGGMRTREAAALWVMGSAGAIRQLPILTGMKELTILVDHDNNNVGISHARACAERWRLAKRKAVLAIPHQTKADFNDLIKGRAP